MPNCLLVGDFPEDFSIITVVKSNKKSGGFLFVIYDGSLTRQVLGLEIGNQSMLLYEDQDGRPGFNQLPRFKVNMADGQ